MVEIRESNETLAQHMAAHLLEVTGLYEDALAAIAKMGSDPRNGSTFTAPTVARRVLARTHTPRELADLLR